MASYGHQSGWNAQLSARHSLTRSVTLPFLSLMTLILFGSHLSGSGWSASWQIGLRPGGFGLLAAAEATGTLPMTGPMGAGHVREQGGSDFIPCAVCKSTSACVAQT